MPVRVREYDLLLEPTDSSAVYENPVRSFNPVFLRLRDPLGGRTGEGIGTRPAADRGGRKRSAKPAGGNPREPNEDQRKVGDNCRGVTSGKDLRRPREIICGP